MNIWNDEIIINDTGKNATCQLRLTERIPGTKEIKRCVSIKDGKVINKPDDVDIIGENTSKGFIIRGIELNTERTNKCITCGEHKNVKDFWDNNRREYSKLCKECRNNTYIIDTEYDEEGFLHCGYDKNI